VDDLERIERLAVLDFFAAAPTWRKRSTSLFYSHSPR
jgi:hypothetical protein